MNASARAAAVAAKVIRVKGQVSAALPTGEIRSLVRGDTVVSSETISTGPNSIVQLNFTDGSIVTLRPNTRFQVQSYHFKQSDQSQDSSFFRLVKGGLRTISGLIGHRSKKEYRVETPVATVGIRGTDYELRECAGDCQDVEPTPNDGLYIGVNSTDHGSRIVVTNNAGEIDLTAGQFAYVAGLNQAALPLALRPPALGAKPLICD